VTAARSAKAGSTLPLAAHVEWLACRDICIPGRADVELALPVRDTAPVRSTHAEFFDPLGARQ